MRNKWLVFPAFIALSCLQTDRIMAASPLADTAKTQHVPDGDISEWKADKFQTDKETQVLYAVDHDAQYLHLAMKVPGMPMQMKMMRMGMNLYVDKKGKQKENTGVQFPLKGAANFAGASNAERTPGQAPDMNAMREKLAATMIFLKTFGFNSDDEKTQMISGGADGIEIGFAWDDANVFYIEYQLPLSLIGKTADLAGKPIAIGWKINGAEESGPPVPTAVSSSIVSVPAGRGGGGGTRRGGSSLTGPEGNAMFRSDAVKEQRFWTKYTIGL